MNWRFDTRFSTLIVEITCQLRFFCFLIDYIDFYLFFFVSIFNFECRNHLFYYAFAFVFAFMMIFIIRFFCSAHYSIVNFDNNLFKHLRTSHWNLIENIAERIAWKTAWRKMKNFHELHACFILRLNLWQKIHVLNTCDNQICTQKTHIRNNRRRSFIWKREK